MTHLKVPVPIEDRDVCLGPDGSVVHVTRVLRMISGCWKLPVLFRLLADPSLVASQFMRDIPGISQKMLIQKDGLAQRRDIEELSPGVEYSLTGAGRGLMPLLMSVREFSRGYPVSR